MPKVGMEPIRRAQVISATIECISEGGLETLTMDAVAKKAGVSKGVVNHYFAGKRDLILQSFKAFLESYNQQIVELIRPDMSAMEILDFIIEVCFPDSEVVLPLLPDDSIVTEKEDSKIGLNPKFSMEALGKVYVHFLAKTILDQDFKDVYLEGYDTYMQGTVEIIKQGIEFGEFRDLDPNAAAYGFLAMIDGIIMYHNIGFKPISSENAKKMCRNYIRRYLLKE